MINDLFGLMEAREERRKGFRLTQIDAAEAVDEWRMREGALQHRTGGFFSVSGFRDRRSGTEHLLLYQPQGAVNGWATRIVDGRRYYLVQARAEPGNVEEVQYGPTLQSTPANYLRLHGGAASPFIEMFLTHNPAISVVFETQQLDQGERYALKTKRVGMIETGWDGDMPKGFHWVAPDVLVAATGKDFVLNTDFKAGLGVLPWSSDPDQGELTPQADVVRRSLDAPLRADVLGEAIVRSSASPCILDPMAVEAMANWRWDENGISEIEPRHDFAVRFFRCEADAREMRAWIQPLVTAERPGMAILACRVRDGMLEVRVRVADEIGLATGRALAPSYVSYPGEPVRIPSWLEPHLDNPWLATKESDEGGRFHNHWSHYILAMVPDGCEPTESGVWVNVAELKQVMMVSNLATIQLRVMAALLLVAP